MRNGYVEDKKTRSCWGGVLTVTAIMIASSFTQLTSAANPSASLSIQSTFGLNSQQSLKFTQEEEILESLPSSSSTTSITFLVNIRGGASKNKPRKRGGRTASLSSLNTSTKSKSKNSQKQKTATGKNKVGASSSSTQSQSALGNTMQKYKSILPLTRLYITLVGLTTLIGLILGEETAQGLLALDPMRVTYGFELWRPITAATFLGKPSIGWLMSAYYLFEYGSSLERAYGTAQQFIFLGGQIFLLSVLSALLGQPFFTSSVITSMLHVLSRSMPHQKVKWLIFTVPYWTLPYGLMASDVLQAGNASAALPHVLGILSGHCYYFHKFIWPKMGGEDWLNPPVFLSKRLDPNYADANNVAKKSIDNALKKRKKGKGRKLGS